jgi:hypothetical protein
MTIAYRTFDMQTVRVLTAKFENAFVMERIARQFTDPSNFQGVFDNVMNLYPIFLQQRGVMMDNITGTPHGEPFPRLGSVHLYAEWLYGTRAYDEANCREFIDLVGSLLNLMTNVGSQPDIRTATNAVIIEIKGMWDVEPKDDIFSVRSLAAVKALQSYRKVLDKRSVQYPPLEMSPPLHNSINDVLSQCSRPKELINAAKANIVWLAEADYCGFVRLVVDTMLVDDLIELIFHYLLPEVFPPGIKVVEQLDYSARNVTTRWLHDSCLWIDSQGVYRPTLGSVHDYTDYMPQMPQFWNLSNKDWSTSALTVFGILSIFTPAIENRHGRRGLVWSSIPRS